MLQHFQLGLDSWPVGRHAWVDSVIFDQQDATSRIQRSAIQQAVGTVRRSAGFRATSVQR